MKLLLSSLIISVLLYSEQYVVIANKKLKNLSTLEIKAIFLKKIRYIDNTAVVPVNLEADNPLRRRFENSFLHMHMKQLQNYWTQQHYLGKRPPINMKSQASVKAFVQKVEGAIGYIEAREADESVKVIASFKDGAE